MRGLMKKLTGKPADLTPAGSPHRLDDAVSLRAMALVCRGEGETDLASEYECRADLLETACPPDRAESGLPPAANDEDRTGALASAREARASQLREIACRYRAIGERELAAEYEAEADQLANRVEAALFIDCILGDLPLPKAGRR